MATEAELLEAFDIANGMIDAIPMPANGGIVAMALGLVLGRIMSQSLYPAHELLGNMMATMEAISDEDISVH